MNEHRIKGQPREGEWYCSCGFESSATRYSRDSGEDMAKPGYFDDPQEHIVRSFAEEVAVVTGAFSGDIEQQVRRLLDSVSGLSQF